MLNHYIKFLLKFNANKKNRNEFFMFRKNNFVLKIIKLFLKYNMIDFYINKPNSDLLIIYINYKSGLTFKNMYKKSHLFFFKKKYLKNINKINLDYILMTDIGFININESKKLNKGGIILYKIENS